MVDLVIVSGPCGKGRGRYESEILYLPDDSRRPVESLQGIDVHGDVAGGGREGWSGDILRGLKGGLSLASNLELTGGLALAAGAMGAGLSALGGEEAERPKSLAELTFIDGAVVLALVDGALPALLLHDRDVVRRTAARLAEIPSIAAPGEAAEAGLLSDARRAAQDAADAVGSAAGAVGSAAGAALGSAMSLLRRGKRPEE